MKDQTYLANCSGSTPSTRCAFLLRSKDDECIAVMDQDRPTVEAQHDLSRKPVVQHFVQVDVGKDRRNTTARRTTGFRVLNPPVLNHARLQPLADESQQHSVTYPLAHDTALSGTSGNAQKERLSRLEESAAILQGAGSSGERYSFQSPKRRKEA